MSDILSMSDEEILAMSPADREKLMAAEPEPQPVEEEVEAEAHVEPEPAPEPQPEPEPEPQPELEEQPVVAESEPAPQVDQPAAEEPAPVEEEPKGPTAEEQLAKLMTSFKASGRDFKVNSVDEAIQLMQKGVNYHDKMHGLKPVMGIARMLEREGLLDEGKLSFLIDLHKKNPEAIAKLVKESGVDTLEVDDKRVAAYKPNSYGLTQQENALEDALAELQQSPSHDRVIKLVNTGMDHASRKTVLENPHVLLHIANQIDSGVYDVIQAEIDKQRILGNLRGVSDLQAYDQIGNALNAQGAFNHLQRQAPAQVPQQPAPVVVAPQQPAAKVATAAKVAAAPAKTTTAPPVKPKAFNPLAMSDEEFMKLAGKPL